MGKCTLQPVLQLVHGFRFQALVILMKVNRSHTIEGKKLKQNALKLNEICLLNMIGLCYK